MIESSDHSIVNQLDELIKLLNGNKLTILNDLQERIDSVLIELQDIGNEINNNALSTEINPQRLDELNNQNNIRDRDIGDGNFVHDGKLRPDDAICCFNTHEREREKERSKL